jgi:polysaccharide pyruvyl transferase WcaK-like protein
MSLVYHFRPATPNIGNELIVMALHELIAKVANHPCDIINMPAKGVDSVIKLGGITRQVVNDINELGAGVLIGPGNLFENNGLEIDAVALDALRIPPLIFSVSWGRIFSDAGELHSRSDAMGREMIGTLCRKAGGILVRDERTQTFLQTLGIENVQVVGCPVLALEPNCLPLPSGVDSRVEGAALVSIRNPLLMNISPRLQGRVHTDVRRIIDRLYQMGYDKVALLCHDLRDLRFAAAYADVPALYTENPLQYLAWLRDCRLNVTFRLHSFLPCAVLGTPSVHFTYDERAAGLIEVAKLQGCDVDYVHAADPVEQALALCADPVFLTQTASLARPHWQNLRRIMQAGLSNWIHQMER